MQVVLPNLLTRLNSLIITSYLSYMKITVTKSEVKEVIDNLKKGVQYRNDNSGISFSYGQAMLRMDANGNMKFYNTIEQMARAIVRFQKRGY
jgi:hypothetical protein